MAIEEDPPAGVPEWIVSFGDMMSLLLCFFVLLFAMGKTEQKKFQAMSESLRAKFGHTLSKRSMVPGDSPPLNSRRKRLGSDQAAVLEKNELGKRPNKTDKRQRMEATRSGELATLGTVITFPEADAELTDRHKEQLQAACRILQGKANRIEIRGHATGRPPGPDDHYADEWDLAFRRCRATLDYLLEQPGIDRRRIRLGVAGRNEPLRGWKDGDKIAENSRVEVYLLSETADLAGAEAPAAKLIP